MGKIDGFQISEKEFNELNQRVENIYNELVVIDYFCQNQKEIEELYNLSPIIGFLLDNADRLNSLIIKLTNSNNDFWFVTWQRMCFKNVLTRFKFNF